MVLLMVLPYFYLQLKLEKYLIILISIMMTDANKQFQRAKLVEHWMDRKVSLQISFQGIYLKGSLLNHVEEFQIVHF